MVERAGPIDTGDSVFHRPTGETWVVAYVRDDRLAWCGWPEGEAAVADCELKTSATDDYREKLLRDMASMALGDARRRYATHRLESAANRQGKA